MRRPERGTRVEGDLSTPRRAVRYRTHRSPPAESVSQRPASPAPGAATELLHGPGDLPLLLRLDARGHRLLAELLLPELHLVVARRQVRDLEGTVRVGHGDVRVLLGDPVRAHPAVDVALDLDR